MRREYLGHKLEKGKIRKYINKSDNTNEKKVESLGEIGPSRVS
jgi:hypothetical protein